MSSLISVILLAGGSGSRFGSLLPKQFHDLHGKPLIRHSYDFFCALPWVSQIIVVCAEAYQPYFPSATYAAPGLRRQDSLFNGFIKSRGDWIIVHDGARPLLLKEDIENLKEATFTYGAATLATPAKVTIKEATADGLVDKTLPRDKLWEIQTPQMIKRSWLTEGFDFARAHSLDVTDDVSLIEPLGHPVKLVPGSPFNIKVTTPIDLILMKELLCPVTA
jgi:2-C-methyl-D-erythritol 4-phosphate cytidylyltransferase